MKILFAVHGTEINKIAIDFACYMANLKKSVLNAVFLEDLEYEEVHISDISTSTEHDILTLSPVQANSAAIKTCNKNITRLKEICKTRQTDCKVYRDRKDPFNVLIEETRFSDLLIVESSLCFGYPSSNPSSTVKNILRQTECPVIIAPEVIQTIKEIVFVYDGQRSSSFAIKQFTYLFPELNHLKLTAIGVKNTKTIIREQAYIEDWIKEYYDDVDFIMLNGDIETRLVENVLKKESSILIMGAYSNRDSSSFVKEGYANNLIKVVPYPIFIAHC